jgi:type I restriction enzyme S subunit
MEVRPGYKQTEAGVIPEDWNAESLDQIADPKRPICYGIVQVGRFSNNGITVLAIKNLNGDYVTNLHRCSLKIEKAYARSRVRPGDVLVSVKGTVGRIGLVPPHFSGNISRDLARIALTDSDVPAFWYQLLQSAMAQRRLEATTVGTTRMELSIGPLKQVKMPRPSKEEQYAIATVLRDADSLLGALDRLIVKKRDLKQAAMQQLLTGQARLPGFTGEWEVTTLGDLGSTFGGLTGKTKADFGEGLGRYIPFMNIMTNVVVDCDAFEQVKISPGETQNRVVKGDLLFNGSSETPEEVAMCALLAADVQDVFLNSFCFGFRFQDGAEADGLFLAYYLRSNAGRELMKSLAQGSTRYNLSKVALLKSPLRLPALPEQVAIASVLTDMDAELTALEQRLAKTCDLKQAMMQELLTGETRLVSLEASHA